ncbi:hypothetical protein Syun_023536 [Stephania yunnanensis]|uniref:Protein kinase domain-containing protein n=1 Tax=Stephania yunnanensis TaxID=152371 RepID=A0AAP0FC77_9MAGN
MDPCQSVVDTTTYMSPERIDTDLAQGAYDGCVANIWSFGVSILELYLGRFPFGASGDWATLMCAICMSRPPEAPPSASPHFRHFVASCLHKDRATCWTAMQLLRHPFITCSFFRPPPPPPPPPTSPSRTSKFEIHVCVSRVPNWQMRQLLSGVPLRLVFNM